jgi:uncharacterized protein YuzB (UPF0349 family)
VEFFGFAEEFAVHQVPHGKEADDLFATDDREVAALVVAHALHRNLNTGGVLHGGDLGRHDLRHGRLFWIQSPENDTGEEVAFAENTQQAAVLQDNDRSNIQLSHLAAYVGDRMSGGNEIQISIDNVLDQNHLYLVYCEGMRANLFIKVEVEYVRGEKPEDLAIQICRQVMKVYGVRTAELSSVAPEDK